MKFDDLRSIGHNIADSLASGIGLLIGVYEMDVFGEAARSPEGFITVDFLTGQTQGARPSSSLSRAIGLYAKALPRLCTKHRTTVGAFRTLSVRYSMTAQGRLFVVTVADHRGHQSTDEYLGSPGQRLRVVDHLGRVRRAATRKRSLTRS